jgi:hypothetical protein
MNEAVTEDLLIEVVPLATMVLSMATPIRLDGTPSGTRIIVEFTEAKWTGERLRARTKGRTHGDWLTVGPEGTGCLDFRMLLETDDGALIYVHGLGRNDAVRFFEGAPNYFTMSFETGAESYAWLNRIQAVAKGRLDSGQPDKIRFEVFELR